MSSTGKTCSFQAFDNALLEHVLTLALEAVDPFPVFLPSAPIQSSQGLKHELSLRVRTQTAAYTLQLPLLLQPGRASVHCP